MGSLFSHCAEDGSSLDLIKPGFPSSEELLRVNSYIYFSGLLVDLLKNYICVLILHSCFYICPFSAKKIVSVPSRMTFYR